MTTVVHHVLDPDGVPLQGQTITITLMLRLDVAPDSYDLNAPDPFTGNPISRTSFAVSDSSGFLSWNLVPNDQIVPSGTYYEAHGLGTSRTFLYVPASEFAVELSECVLALVDLGGSNLVLVQGPRGRQGGDSTGGLGLPVASPTLKGILALAGDLGGTADEPTVVSGVNHDHTSAQISDATETNVPNTVVRRAGNGGISVGSAYVDDPQPVFPNSLARKDYADGLALVDGTVATSNPTADTLVRRNQYGASDFQYATALVQQQPNHLSRKDYVDQQVATRAAIAGDLGGTPASPTVPGLANKSNLGHTHAVTDLTATGTRDSTKFLRGDNVWAAAATLDGTGKIPQAQMPAVALTDFLGAVATQAAMLALVGQRGDWCTRTDKGTDWQLIADDPTLLANWRERTYPASPVSSVAGRTGAVTLSSADITDTTTTGRAVMTAATAAAARTTLGAGTASTKTDVGLGNVDNTSDVNKPVSTAQQTALNGKVTNGAGVTTITVLTQAAYTALATKDAATLYVIQG